MNDQETFTITHEGEPPNQEAMELCMDKLADIAMEFVATEKLKPRVYLQLVAAHISLMLEAAAIPADLKENIIQTYSDTVLRLWTQAKRFNQV